MKFTQSTILAFVGLALVTLGADVSAQTTGPKVTSELVVAAGFTNAKVVEPTANRFLTPVHYFRVKESVAQSLGWGLSSDVVAVLIRPIPDKEWTYNGGQMEVKEIEGKTQANISSQGYYISVTGPDKEKVMTLAHNLKVLN